MNLFDLLGGRKRFAKKFVPRAAILKPDSGFTLQEAYKATRTNVMFAFAGQDEDVAKVIAVTSAEPGAGKSTNTINLAITFAKTGCRVLLIDADLRCATVHQYLEVKNKRGLSNVLGGFITFEEAVAHSDEYNLDYLTAGSVPPNPSELLASPKMKQMLDNLKESYDYIFIDTPPIGVVTDAVILAKIATGTILVARKGYTTYEALRRTLRSVEMVGVRPIGVILNASNESVHYGGLGGYNYYHSKTHSYEDPHFGDDVDDALSSESKNDD